MDKPISKTAIAAASQEVSHAGMIWVLSSGLLLVSVAFVMMMMH